MQRPDEITSDPLVDQAYWDRAYEHMRPEMAPETDPLRQWIERTVPKANGSEHCLEIGCFPGRYLAVLGKLGYTLHGIDLTPAIDRMAPALREMGFRTGEFEHADFLQYEVHRQYDLVCSFGFIEHFPQWRKVLRKHADLVRPGGLIVIETPNFRGWVQQLFHRWLDAENLRRHHIPAMSPSAWARVLKKEGFEIIEQGFIGRFVFWNDSQGTNFWKRIGFKLLRTVTPTLEKLPPSPAVSPYGVLIARKIKPE